MPTLNLNTSDTTFVSSVLPDTNFSTSSVIYSGMDTNFQDTVSYLKFTLTDLSVPSVDSAVLWLAVIIKTGLEPSRIAANRVTSEWNTASVTYNNRPAMEATPSQIDIGSYDLYSTVQIDITPLVNQWLAGTVPNNGLALTQSVDSTVVGFGTNEILYEPFSPKLILNYSETPEQPDSCAYVYNTENQSIPAESPIPFSNNGVLMGIAHNTGSSTITVENSGTYAVWLIVNSQEASQFALFLNDTVIPESNCGAEPDSVNNSGMVIINAAAGDVLTVRNHTSQETVILDNTAGGTQQNVNASILILKIDPDASGNPALEAVNNAQNITELRIAMENPELGLDLTAFHSLETRQQDQVLNELLENRPALGPADLNLQEAPDAAVSWLADPYNIYVKAGSAGGNGSLALPFGTIEEGIAAVNTGGTVHILAGTYPITSKIEIDRNITLSGEPGTLLLLKANLVPLVFYAPARGAGMEGLTITSDIPYAKEFIFSQASGLRFINNTIYGPPQELPMENWVDNRAVLFDTQSTDLVIQNNTLHTLRTGMYFHPKTVGESSNNVVYNTRYGIFVYDAFITFTGNSWEMPGNEYDIVLWHQTTKGRPYDDLPALSAANHNAVISDKRNA